MELPMPRRKITYCSSHERDMTQNDLRKKSYLNSYIISKCKEYKLICKPDCYNCKKDNIERLFLIFVLQNYNHYKSILKRNNDLNIETELLNNSNNCSELCKVFSNVNYLTYILLCMFD